LLCRHALVACVAELLSIVCPFEFLYVYLIPVLICFVVQACVCRLCLWTVKYCLPFRVSLRLFNSCVNFLYCASLRLLYHAAGSFVWLLLKYVDLHWKYEYYSQTEVVQLTTEMPWGIPYDTLFHVIIFSKQIILNMTYLSQNISQFLLFGKRFFLYIYKQLMNTFLLYNNTSSPW
jgi:hypothetical protein